MKGRVHPLFCAHMQRVEECIKRLLREGDLSTLSLESVHAAVGLEMGKQWVVDHQQQVDDMVDSLLLMQSDAGSNNNSSSSSSDDSDIDSSTSSVQSSDPSPVQDAGPSKQKRIRKKRNSSSEEPATKASKIRQGGRVASSCASRGNATDKEETALRKRIQQIRECGFSVPRKRIASLPPHKALQELQVYLEEKGVRGRLTKQRVCTDSQMHAQIHTHSLSRVMNLRILT